MRSVFSRPGLVAKEPRRSEMRPWRTEGGLTLWRYSLARLRIYRVPRRDFAFDASFASGILPGGECFRTALRRGARWMFSYHSLDRGAGCRRGEFSRGWRGAGPVVPDLLASHLRVHSQARSWPASIAGFDPGILRRVSGKTTCRAGRAGSRTVSVLFVDVREHLLSDAHSP